MLAGANGGIYCLLTMRFVACYVVLLKDIQTTELPPTHWFFRGSAAGELQYKRFVGALDFEGGERRIKNSGQNGD